MTSVFFAFRDAPDRRAALATRGSLDRYRLFGLDEIAAHGASVRHNLEQGRPAWARATGRAINAALDAAGGLGGDFASILASRRAVNETDVVFSTVDTVGIPLMQLKRAGLVRPPVVYASIGLPERLAQARNARLFGKALRSARTIIAYASFEADRLRDWLGADAPRVVFVPFGVDTEAFRPAGVHPEVDVVSIGADPRRDFELLLEVATRQTAWSFRIVAPADRVRSLGATPANVSGESDLPLESVRERMTQARVLALPVRENSYSGATTTLLQGMAMAKPVVVSRTDAIAEGYELEDRVNCRLVPPGDTEAFEHALSEVLADESAARALGTRARETVVRHFSWQRYTDAVWEILSAASGRP